MNDKQIDKTANVRPEEITSTISRDDLRSLFYIFSRKPNKVSQNFYGNSIIKKDDIIELSKKLYDKLQLHQIDAYTTSIIISLDNNKFIEFGDIDKFADHTFDEGETVENIVLKYDFLLSVDRSIIPQQYSINVRLAGSVSPMFLLRFVLNQDQSDDIDNILPPCIVNVDFFESIMSDELIQIVGNWYKARRQVIIEGKILEWIKKKNLFFSTISSLFSMAIGIIISSILLFRYDFAFLNQIDEYKKTAALMLVFLGIVWIFRYIGKLTGYSLEKIIRKIGEIPIFQITKGDFANIDKIEQKNANSRAKLLLHCCIQFFIGFFSSLVVWLITNKK